MSRVCGVSITGGSAIFVVLESDQDNFEVIDTKFKKIDLDDDTNQEQVKSFFTAVEDFFRQNKIDTVFVKKGNTSGKYSASSRSFKIEALIQIMPFEVKLIASQTVAAFLKKNKIPSRLSSQVYKYQEDALKLGFYGLEV
jgi:hypothetical protein